MTAPDPLLKSVVARVAAEWGVPTRKLRTKERGSRRAVRARQVAMYLAVVGHERTRESIAPFFRRHPTVIGHALRVVEDLRDDPDFDARIARLEAWLTRSFRNESTERGDDRFARLGAVPVGCDSVGSAARN